MRFTSLEDWLEWQSQLHLKSIDLGLERVSKVWDRLHPDKLKAFVITVAGTNGKGSSVAMLEAILLAAGYSVGCYTSPHLVRYNERIHLNGEEADDDQICAAFAAIDEARQDISLTYFEFGTLAALYLSAKAEVDVIVLEVGLGGRLDAVNIIDADAALITSIGLDHQDWLGDDREKIGREKAGILRANQAAVFSGHDIPASIVDYAQSLGTKLLVAGRNYHTEQLHDSWNIVTDHGNRSGLPLPLMRGRHQLENAAGVVALLLDCNKSLPVSIQAIRQGLLTAQVKGRFEVINQPLTVVVDVAHNEQSMQVLSENLSGLVVKGKLHAVAGMLKDKDIENSLKPLLPLVDRWYLVDTPGERGLSATELSAILKKISPDSDCQTYEKVSDAYESVIQYAQDEDTVLVTGSFLVTGQFLENYS